MSWSWRVLGCDGSGMRRVWDVGCDGCGWCGWCARERVVRGRAVPSSGPPPRVASMPGSAERLDLTHELSPRLVDGLLTLLDSGECLLRRVVDLEVVRP